MRVSDDDVPGDSSTNSSTSRGCWRRQDRNRVGSRTRTRPRAGLLYSRATSTLSTPGGKGRFPDGGAFWRDSDGRSGCLSSACGPPRTAADGLPVVPERQRFVASGDVFLLDRLVCLLPGRYLDLVGKRFCERHVDILGRISDV